MDEQAEEQDPFGDILAQPDVALQMFGTVQGQEYDEPLKYDPFAITEKLQETVLSYVTAPPINTDDETEWLCLLGYRQGGKSLSAELAFWAKTEYVPGWEHICAADNKDRADYLFERVMYNRNRWPEKLLGDTHPHETRQLSLKSTWDNKKHGGKMRVITGNTAGAGVGRGTSSFHGSELPLWKDAPTQFSLIFPSMFNRKRSMLLLESTAFPMDQPSSPWYRAQCQAAKRGEGRFRYAFFPFWDGKLNQRRWRQGWKLTIEEQKLLDRYYKSGLRKSHLAFRRAIMATDQELQRNPDLFRVYYPFDDLTCWLTTANAVIKSRHLEKHLDNLVDWTGPYMEYEAPEIGAPYVIGVDPAGYGARDHASFHVLKAFAGEWNQAATYASVVDPPVFARFLFDMGRRYNDALICVERNGVGVAVVALLEEWGYPNIYYDRGFKPGIHKSSHEQMLSYLIDALMDELVINDYDTVAQMQTYQSDMVTQRSIKSELLRPGQPTGRRERHHWDKVSALMVACLAARASAQPQRVVREPTNIVPFHGMTYHDLERYDEKLKARKTRTTGRRATYRSIRRKR